MGQENTYRRWTLAVILPLIVLLCACTWSLGYRPGTRVRTESGVCDLTGLDFAGGEIGDVSGDLEFVDGALLTPEEFAGSDQIQLGIPGASSRFATTRLRLRVPDGKTYAVAGRTAGYASRIFVNGVWLSDYGVPGTEKGTSKAGEGYIIFTAVPKDGEIEIIQQSSNYVFRQNKHFAEWSVGYEEPVLRMYASYTHANFLMIGCYSAMFLVHLILYLILRSYQANLYFALLCFVWVIRAGVTGPKVFFNLFPGLSWEMALRLEYLSLPLAMMFVMLAYYHLFPQVVRRLSCIAVTAVMVLYLPCCFWPDTVQMSQSIRLIEGAGMATGIWLLIRIIVKVRRPTTEQALVLAGLSILLAGLALDTIYYTGILPGRFFPALPAAVMEYVIMAFSFLQVTAMVLGTMQRAAQAWEREQKMRLENEALDRVNALRARMMADISHEVRTPLAVMSGYAELIAMDLHQRGTDSQMAADMDRIASESRRLADIMQEMQALARMEDDAADWKNFQVGEVILKAAPMYRHILERKHTKLVLQAPRPLPDVYGSEGQITQVLFNLLSNAGKHTERGTVTVAARREGEFIAVSVSDTGSGISPEILPRIFERHVRGDKEGQGQGLGLAICREIIEAHGGVISIESRQDKGTSVRFTLPVWEKGASDG